MALATAENQELSRCFRASTEGQRTLEMIMGTTISTLAAAQAAAARAEIGAPLRGWWKAFLAWRIEQAAIAQLGMMNDRELKDIGLTRPQIIGAVRGDLGHRSFYRYY
jgi:uncharacterized protein YjiS (DUF1127 family)